MTQQEESKLQEGLLSLLKIDDNGWNIELFQDPIKMNACLCNHCGGVSCNPVELSCDHDDNDIYVYCHTCLSNMISDNDDKCPINKHDKPIIVSSRALRRHISRSMIVCPYSVHCKQAYNEEGKQEGIASNNSGCKWKGTLHDLLTTDHLNKCIKRYDAAFSKDINIAKLEKQVKAQQTQIDELKSKLDATIEENKVLKQKMVNMKDSYEATIRNLQIKLQKSQELKHQQRDEIRQGLYLRKVAIWNPKDEKWDVLSKRSKNTNDKPKAQFYRNGNTNKEGIIIWDQHTGKRMFDHIIPLDLSNRCLYHSANFQCNDEYARCQWRGLHDEIQGNKFNIAVFFGKKTKETYQTFINAFQASSFMNQTTE